MVNDDSVIVNLHYKSDGILPINEIRNPDNLPLTELFKVGEEIEVLVLKPETKEGDVLLSSKRVKSRKDWSILEEKFKNNETVTVKIDEVVKGGLSAFYNDIRGFIPASHISLGFENDLKKFVGNSYEAHFLEFDRRRNQVVLSVKKVLEEQKNEELEKFWSKIEVGQIVQGTIRRFTPYGAFVEIGPTDALLHITEIQWGKIMKPSELLKLNDVHEFLIVAIDKEEGKIALSMKQLMPDPWLIVDDLYKEGEKYDAKVVNITDFGAFVQLQPGLEGLVHVSQISEDRVEHPKELLDLGEVVVVKIIDIDSENKKIKLTMKE